MTDAITKPCTKAEAQVLTDRIRQNVDQLWALLLDAHDRRAWKAMGYQTWGEYVGAEFAMGRQRSYQILDQGRVIEAIREVAGVSTTGRQNDVRGAPRTKSNPALGIDISERDARDIKPDLPAVTEDIRTRVEAGQDPQKAVAEVVADKRAEKAQAKAEKAAQQAEWDRQQEEARRSLNPAVQRGEQAKHANGARNAVVVGSAPVADTESPEAVAAHRDELLEEVAALRADVVDRDRRLAAFDAMAVQFEKGGFEAVIATKDERIRGLQRDVETMSADRAKLARSRDFWRKAAISLGYVSENSQVRDEQVGDVDLSEEAGF